MRTVKLTRPFAFIGCAVALRVIVDGMVEARLGAGKTVEIPIDEGAHRVQVTSDDGLVVDIGGGFGYDAPPKYSNILRISEGTDNRSIVARFGWFNHELTWE